MFILILIHLLSTPVLARESRECLECDNNINALVITYNSFSPSEEKDLILKWYNRTMKLKNANINNFSDHPHNQCEECIKKYNSFCSKWNEIHYNLEYYRNYGTMEQVNSLKQERLNTLRSISKLNICTHLETPGQPNDIIALLLIILPFILILARFISSSRSLSTYEYNTLKSKIDNGSYSSIQSYCEELDNNGRYIPTDLKYRLPSNIRNNLKH